MKRQTLQRLEAEHEHKKQLLEQETALQDAILEAQRERKRERTQEKHKKMQQEQDKNLSFPAAKLEATAIQDIQPQAGLKKGLVLILDAHTNFVSGGTVFDNFRGFLTTISSPKQFPMTTKNSLLIKPGQYNTVGITALSVKADDAIFNSAGFI